MFGVLRAPREALRTSVSYAVILLATPKRGLPSAMTAVLILLTIVIAAPYVIVVFTIHRVNVTYQKSQDKPVLEEWAKCQGARLLGCEPQAGFLRPGCPWQFFMPGERLYRISAEDSRGVVRHGWARCRNIFRRNIGNVEVYWNTPAPTEMSGPDAGEY